MSSGESKDLRVAERGQLAKVYLRRTEGQALCLQLAAEKPVHMPEWRKISRPLLLKLFWHVVAREMGGGRWPCHRLPLLHLISQTGPLFFQLLMYISIPATFIWGSGQTPSAAPSAQTAPRTAQAHLSDRQTHGERTNIIKPESKHTHYSISSLRLLDKEGNLFLTQSQA